MTKQEFLLIESYALGYLAHKLDEYSIERDFLPMALYDICFVDLIKLNGMMTMIGCIIPKSVQKEVNQLIKIYEQGYHDSMSGLASKVKMADRVTGKTWNHSVNILDMVS